VPCRCQFAPSWARESSSLLITPWRTNLVFSDFAVFFHLFLFLSRCTLHFRPPPLACQISTSAYISCAIFPSLFSHGNSEFLRIALSLPRCLIVSTFEVLLVGAKDGLDLFFLRGICPTPIPPLWSSFLSPVPCEMNGKTFPRIGYSTHSGSLRWLPPLQTPLPLPYTTFNPVVRRCNLPHPRGCSYPC